MSTSKSTNKIPDAAWDVKVPVVMVLDSPFEPNHQLEIASVVETDCRDNALTESLPFNACSCPENDNQHDSLMTEETSFLGKLSDDVLSKTLSFLNFDEACRVVCHWTPIATTTTTTSRSFHSLAVWGQIFQRRGFSGQDIATTSSSFSDYWQEFGKRERLLQNLWRNSNRTNNASLCQSSLATSFVPRALLWNTTEDYYMRRNRRYGVTAQWEFQLTSTAVASELLLSDRDNRGMTTLAVHPNPVTTSGGRHYNALQQAAIEIMNGEIRESSSRQVLFRVDPDDVLGRDVLVNNTRLLPAKPILAGTSTVVTTMVGLILEQRQQDENFDGTHTEFRFWVQTKTANHTDSSRDGLSSKLSVLDIADSCLLSADKDKPVIITVDDPKVFEPYIAHGGCRVQGTCGMVDFANCDDPRKQLVYVARPSRWEEPDNRTTRETRRPPPDATTRTIEAYSIIPAFYETNNEMGGGRTKITRKEFPQPSFVLDCQETILAFCVSPTGNEVLVATTHGTLQIWDVSGENSSSSSIMQARLSHSVPFHSAIRRAFQGLRDTSFLISLIILGQHRHAEIAVKILIPRHLPLKTCGFVTLQTSRASLRSTPAGGHTALFWERKKETDSIDEWGIFAMINLPLLPHRTPQLYYDGNRFIAFGQDHLGLIILIYQVRSTLESISSAVLKNETKCAAECQNFRRDDAIIGKEASGGVYNFTNNNVPRVIFANRVRDDALGGMEPSEHLQMTCNERFLFLHTKTGDRLHQEDATSTCHADGLLIFDLDDTTPAASLRLMAPLERGLR